MLTTSDAVVTNANGRRLVLRFEGSCNRGPGAGGLVHEASTVATHRHAGCDAGHEMPIATVAAAHTDQLERHERRDRHGEHTDDHADRDAFLEPQPRATHAVRP